MTYRLNEIEVPFDDPFRNDVLGRKDSVIFLANLVEQTGGPFVLAIDAPWGNGKTIFVQMLKATLMSRGFRCVYFNAWQFDYLPDPLVAMVSILDELVPQDSPKFNDFKKRLNTLGEITSIIANRGAVLAIKALTAGLVDIQVEIEQIKKVKSATPATNIISSFRLETEQLVTFREVLENAVGISSDSIPSKSIIFFIDELDRCRPNFSIALLERVKHLFDVQNIIFVLSIDKSQLESSIKAIYGSGINAPAYLRKFIDIEFGIPEPSSKAHTSHLISKFGLDLLFNKRQGQLLYDQSAFIDSFSQIADLVNLTLRDRERCMTRMKVVMDQTAPNQYLDPILTATLIILRIVEPAMFIKVCSGEIAPLKVMSFIRELPGGTDFAEARLGLLLEAYLITTDDNEKRREQSYENLRSTINTQSEDNPITIRANSVFSNIQNLNTGRNSWMSLRQIASKIDLAARIL